MEDLFEYKMAAMFFVGLAIVMTVVVYNMTRNQDKE